MGHVIAGFRAGWFEKDWWVPSERDVALAKRYAMHRREAYADTVARAIYDDMMLGKDTGGSFRMDGHKILPYEHPEGIFLVGGAYEGLVMEFSESKSYEDVHAAMELLREAVVGLQEDSDDPVVIGYWLDSMDDNRVYFDVSNMLLDESEAIALARSRGELAIYDMANGRDVRVADVRRAELAAPPFDSKGYADFMRRRMQSSVRKASEKSLADVFGDIRSISDMGEFEGWEAEDYGIESDEGFPFYAEVKNGYLLSIVHQDGDWSGAIYGMGYGDYYCGAELCGSAEQALDRTLDAAKGVVVSVTDGDPYAVEVR